MSVCQNHRLFRRLLTAMAVLTALTLPLTACRQGPRFAAGDLDYTFNHRTWLQMAVTSDTDTFDKDNITVNLSIGTYDSGYCREYNTDPKAAICVSDYASVFFALYLCDDAHSGDINNNVEIARENIRSLEHHTFVREIPADECFSEAYGYTMTYKDGVTYGSSLPVTIPAEMLFAETGTIGFKLIAYCVHEHDSAPYLTSDTHYIGLDYEVLTDGTVKLIFD